MEALALAFEAHEGQKRKISGAPYFVHLLDVVRLLMESGASEDVVVAGALHDVLEDTRMPATGILQRFGEEVLDLVVSCTEPGNTPGASDEELRRTWRSRKEHAVEKAARASDDELLLKLADVLANISSLCDDRLVHGEGVWEGFRGGKQGNEWYFSALGDIFSSRDLPRALVLRYRQRLEELFPRK